MRQQLLCTELIGRREERDRLMRLVRASGTAIVFGEPGIGKSRLVSELVHTVQAQGTVVLAGRAVQTGPPLPYRPIAEAVLSGCRRRGLPASADLAPYRAALGKLIPEWCHPELTSSAESAVVIGEGVLRLLQTMDSGAGVLLVLEDLHWADPESLAVLEYLADHGREAQLACIVTARPDPTPASEVLNALVARRAAVRLELPPLRDGDSLRIAQSCLHLTTLPIGLTELVASAEGIPFLIEELLAAAADSGALVAEDGDWTFRPGTAAIVPRTLADSVTQRTNSLDPDECTVLRVAALFGRHIEPSLIAQTLGILIEAVDRVLDRCVDLQLISLDTSDGHQFRHALTRESVLAGTPPSVRASLAERCHTVLEEFHPDLPGRWCQTAAELRLVAGNVTGAANLLLRFGRRALDQGALATATTALRHARLLVPDSSDLAMEIDELRTEVAASAGDYGTASAVGMGLLQSSIDPKRGTRVRLLLAQAASTAGQWATAEEHLRHADAVEETMRVTADALTAHIQLGALRPAEAAATARRALASAERLDLAEPACQALEVLGRIARIHDLHAAELAFARQLEIATKHHLSLWEVRASHELGTIDMLATDGVERLLQARVKAAAAGALATVATLDLQLAAAALMAFDVTACLEATARCQQAARRFKMHSALATALTYEAHAHALTRNRPAMERAITEAMLSSPNEPFIESMAWVSRAWWRLLHDDPEGTLAAHKEALAAERRSMSFGLGPHWGLSVLLQTVQEDEAEAARNELRTLITSGTYLNESLLGYADAVAAGRRGEPRSAELMFAAARSRLATGRGSTTWRHLAERLVAERALQDGWGCPVDWLTEASDFFHGSGYVELERACRSLLRQAGATVPRRPRPGSHVPEQLAALGVTEREADVLALIIEGLTSKEIAARLYISWRTVDKHVERLLAKTGVPGRLQLRRWNT